MILLSLSFWSGLALRNTFSLGFFVGIVTSGETLKFHLQQELSRERDPSMPVLLQRNSPSKRVGDPCCLLPLIPTVSEGEGVLEGSELKRTNRASETYSVVST